MPSACFDAIFNVSTPWKHAEGMSLRYGAVIFGGLTHPPLCYGVTLFVSAASPCVGVLVLFSGLHLIGYVLGPGVDVVGEFGGVGQVYLHVGAYA